MVQALDELGAPPRYSIQEDLAGGVVRVVVSGFFDLPTLQRHFSESAELVRRWRAAGLAIRILIDATKQLPHSPQGQAYVEKSAQSIYAPGDRVAIRVSSNLAKMQMRRTHPHQGIIQFFVSEDAAMTWLSACDGR